MAVEDPDLMDWSDLVDHEWDGLIVGNGASQAVWQAFGYGSLFEIACAPDLPERLSAEGRRLFDELDTQNFERVLAAVSTTRAVNDVFGIDDDTIADIQNEVRDALIAAVHRVHVPWPTVQPVLPALNAELARYDSVFSLNYDLILYWAIMHDSSAFKDMLWDQPFDASNADVGGKYTKVHWLHGGLHLYRGPWGGTYKRAATAEQNLLDLFGTPWEGRSPLFVSEGTSVDKLRTVHTSDYLSFSLQSLASHGKSLVLFGASLDDTDRHVAEAIRRNRRRVAISIRPAEAEDVMAKKARYAHLLPGFAIDFFDSTTHPLGRPEVSVTDVGA